MALGSSHILLVEPDASASAEMRQVLEASGFTVTAARDGGEGLALLRASHSGAADCPAEFHAVVCAGSNSNDDGALDADGQGQTLLERACAADDIGQIPILLVVNPHDDAAIIAGVERGAIDFLQRPVRPVMLLARLRASLERKRLTDRERDYLRLVELERRRAEMLLYDVLPAEIAARMKHGEQVIADSHENVTVLFADLVGFTSYADGRPAAEVVRTLDTLFSRFDELATSYSVEKIKTIGDGYMAASGLPTPTQDHAAAAADLALAMREVVRETTAEDGTQFQMRIGLASGPVIAGVIGQRRHVYDLWGDTVNLASRMESTAPTDGIQLSESTLALLTDRYTVEPRGLVEIKGKSPQHTSLLTGRKRSRRRKRRASFARTARFEVRQALELAEQAMHEMRLVDPETGLLSARGFLPMAETKWRRAAREQRTILLLIAKMDPADVSPDNAKRVAQLLLGTFRDTDLLVRWKSDTFAMVGLERSPTPRHVLGDRLRERALTVSGIRPPPLRMVVRRLKPLHGETEHRLVAMLNMEFEDHELE